MDSAESKIYPGLNGPFKRAVAVYIPSQYVAGTPAPFIVSADAYGLVRRQLPTILDNMIADHRLPVMLAVMIANGGSQRSYEYDTVSGKYAEFVETEVLPRVEKEANVTLTRDPEGRMTYGGSSGGAVALTMAWFRPDLYHRVLTYSGTYVNLRPGPDAPHGAWEYLEHFIPDGAAKPLRVWIEVSERDNGAGSASSERRNWVIANQRLAAVMKAKGYHYQFIYAKGAGHTDGKVTAQTLPQALEYVWKGYPVARDDQRATDWPSGPGQIGVRQSLEQKVGSGRIHFTPPTRGRPGPRPQCWVQAFSFHRIVMRIRLRGLPARDHNRAIETDSAECWVLTTALSRQVPKGRQTRAALSVFELQAARFFPQTGPECHVFDVHGRDTFDGGDASQQAEVLSG